MKLVIILGVIILTGLLYCACISGGIADDQSEAYWRTKRGKEDYETD